MYAVQHEHEGTLQELLTPATLKPAEAEGSKRPAASTAAKDGHTPDQLRNFWGQILAMDRQHRTAFHYAASHGSLLAMNHLLSEVRRMAELAPVPAAAVKELRTMPLDVKHLNKLKGADRSSAVVRAVLAHASRDAIALPLSLAAAYGSSAMIDCLAAAGAATSVERTDDGGPAGPQSDPPLVCAASVGDAGIVRQLLQTHPASTMDEQGVNGETPLHRAAANLRHQVFEILLEEAGAFEVIVGPAPEGWPEAQRKTLERVWRGVALMRACDLGDASRVDRLIVAGAKVRPAMSLLRRVHVRRCCQ